MPRKKTLQILTTNDATSSDVERILLQKGELLYDYKTADFIIGGSANDESTTVSRSRKAKTVQNPSESTSSAAGVKTLRSVGIGTTTWNIPEGGGTTVVGSTTRYTGTGTKTIYGIKIGDEKWNIPEGGSISSGVSKINAGDGISVDPAEGTGEVTINNTGITGVRKDDSQSSITGTLIFSGEGVSVDTNTNKVTIPAGGVTAYTNTVSNSPPSIKAIKIGQNTYNVLNDIVGGSGIKVSTDTATRKYTITNDGVIKIKVNNATVSTDTLALRAGNYITLGTNASNEIVITGTGGGGGGSTTVEGTESTYPSTSGNLRTLKGLSIGNNPWNIPIVTNGVGISVDNDTNPEEYKITNAGVTSITVNNSNNSTGAVNIYSNTNTDRINVSKDATGIKIENTGVKGIQVSNTISTGTVQLVGLGGTIISTDSDNKIKIKSANVVANSQEATTGILQNIKIDETVYSISGGGSSITINNNISALTDFPQGITPTAIVGMSISPDNQTTNYYSFPNPTIPIIEVTGNGTNTSVSSETSGNITTYTVDIGSNVITKDNISSNAVYSVNTKKGAVSITGATDQISVTTTSGDNQITIGLDSSITNAISSKLNSASLNSSLQALGVLTNSSNTNLNWGTAEVTFASVNTDTVNATTVNATTKLSASTAEIDELKSKDKIDIVSNYSGIGTKTLVSITKNGDSGEIDIYKLNSCDSVSLTCGGSGVLNVGNSINVVSTSANVDSRVVIETTGIANGDTGSIIVKGYTTSGGSTSTKSTYIYYDHISTTRIDASAINATDITSATNNTNNLIIFNEQDEEKFVSLKCSATGVLEVSNTISASLNSHVYVQLTTATLAQASTGKITVAGTIDTGTQIINKSTTIDGFGITTTAIESIAVNATTVNATTVNVTTVNANKIISANSDKYISILSSSVESTHFNVSNATFSKTTTSYGGQYKYAYTIEFNNDFIHGLLLSHGQITSEESSLGIVTVNTSGFSIDHPISIDKTKVYVDIIGPTGNGPTFNIYPIRAFLQ